MSTVYLAVQQSLEREVALKIMSPALAVDKSFTKRFLKEGQIVARLTHPHIVTIFDIGVADTWHYMAMEHLEGGNLKQRIRQGLPLNSVFKIIREVAEALALAHEHGYVHRDVKPANIMFRTNGNAVLTDFGIAKALDGNTVVTAVNATTAGTPTYMSPEQARGEELDSRSDQYGLGVVLYECLTKQAPYIASDPFAIALKHINEPIPTLSGELAIFQPLLNRLMAKDRNGRFESDAELTEILYDIEAQYQHLHPSYSQLTVPQTLVKPIERPRMASRPQARRGSAGRVGTIAVALAALATAGIYFAPAVRTYVAQEKSVTKPLAATDLTQSTHNAAAAKPASSEASVPSTRTAKVAAQTTPVAVASTATAPTAPVVTSPQQSTQAAPAPTTHSEPTNTATATQDVAGQPSTHSATGSQAGSSSIALNTTQDAGSENTDPPPAVATPPSTGAESVNTVPAQPAKAEANPVDFGPQFSRIDLVSVSANRPKDAGVTPAATAGAAVVSHATSGTEAIEDDPTVAAQGNDDPAVDTPADDPASSALKPTGKVDNSAASTATAATNASDQVAMLESKPTNPRGDNGGESKTENQGASAGVQELLSTGRQQLSARRLTSPAGDNAYETFQKVLALDPTNPEALAGLDDIADTYLNLALGAKQQGDLRKSLQHVKRGLGIAPKNDALKKLRRDVEAALALADRQNQPADSSPARASSLTSSASTRPSAASGVAPQTANPSPQRDPSSTSSFWQRLQQQPNGGNAKIGGWSKR